MEKIIRVTFSDQSVCYVQGFMPDGDVEIVITRESARKYADWSFPTVIRNVTNNLSYHDKDVIVEAIDPI